VSEPLLASYADRDIALALLREASVDGRLTLEDLADRAELVHTARTRNELASGHSLDPRLARRCRSKGRRRPARP
jgi:hypothetical protein